jgi:hypothetical protein
VKQSKDHGRRGRNRDADRISVNALIGLISVHRAGGSDMRLKFEHFDNHPDYMRVMDEDTDKEVGLIHTGVNGMDLSYGIDISLFDGKYQTRVSRYETAVGFVLGVQSVLNHMTSCVDPQPVSNAA